MNAKSWMAGLLVIVGSGSAYAQYGGAGRPSDWPAFNTPHRGFQPNRTEIAYTIEFNTLEKRTARLLSRTKAGLEPRAGEIEAAVESIRRDSHFLRQRWKDWFKAQGDVYGTGLNPSSDPYLRSLMANNALLKKALEQADSTRQLEWLQSVALDLQVKAEHCRKSKDGLGKVVRVVVHTHKTTNEVSGFEVWFVPKGWWGVKKRYNRFRRLSSPTESLPLAPGGYALWAQRGEWQSAPTTLRLGGSGQDQIEVDLLVEAPAFTSENVDAERRARGASAAP